jgi:hypothetical protein
MRKSTVILLLIIVIAGVVMLIGLDIATERTQETFQAQQRLTRLFADRGDVVQGSQVRLLWENKEPGRAGQGLKVEVTPSQAILTHRGGLRALTRVLTREAPAAFGRVGDVLRWIRIRVFLPEGAQLDTWFERDEEGTFSDPNPPLPELWPETPKPPAPPVTPAPAPGPERPPK